MEIRHAVHPDHAASMTARELREHFLIKDIFVPENPRMVYSHIDRLIVGGVCPTAPVPLAAAPDIIGADFFLERREMGIINIGGKGTVSIDGTVFAMDSRDGLYIGKGARDIVFKSESADSPAKFYFNSAPAHTVMENQKISFDQILPDNLGDQENCNKRSIRKYFHPDGIQTCQLVMGMTTLAPGNVWNTMPPHTHGRRMEAYFYFDMADDQLVFHLMGPASDTRHIVVRNEQAVLSPSWSIHSGAGTRSYVFIWGMAGENQTFSDMDHIPMSELR